MFDVFSGVLSFFRSEDLRTFTESKRELGYV